MWILDNFTTDERVTAIWARKWAGTSPAPTHWVDVVARFILASQSRDCHASLAMTLPFLHWDEVRTEEELSPETGKAVFAHRGTGGVPSVAVFVLWT